MANSSTTVDMILRARDEFSLTFKELGSLTENITKLQGDLSRSFLGSSKTAEKLATELDKVGNANKSILKLAKSIDALIDARDSFQALEADAEGLRQTLANVEAAIADATKGTFDKRLVKDFQDLTAGAQKTEKAIEDTRARLEALKESAREEALAKNRADLEKAVEASRKAQAAYEKQREALKSLTAAERERIAGAVTKADASVEKLTRQYTEQKARVEELALAKGKDGEQTATQAKQLAAAQRRLEAYGTALDKARTAQVEATRAQDAFDRNANASTGVRKASQLLRDLATRARESSAAVKTAAEGLDKATISPRATANIDKLQASLAELETDYRVITREAEKARVAMEASTGPIPKDLQKSLKGLNVDLAKTEQAIDAKRQALNQLEQELKEAGVDTRDLTRAQQQLAGQARKLADAKRNLAGQTSRAGTAQRKYTGDMGNAIHLTRTLRSQIVGLAAAYFGLYEIAGQVADVFNAAASEQGIELRLGVARDGNEEAVRQEMEYLRKEADRLQISFLKAGDEYSKLVNAFPRGQLAVEEQQRIFTGFNTAAVALSLSNEQIGRTFTALTQIAGKGTVQMEELKQQLAEAMPTAINDFAEAAGFGADELDKFYKAVEQGDISSRLLVDVADLMIRKYGDDLPAALQTPAAQLRRFQKAVEDLRLQVAKSGFLDQLTRSLQGLTETLKDPAVQAKLINLAKGIGILLEQLVGLLPYLDKAVYAFVAFQGLKVGAFATQFAAGLGAVRTKVVALNKTLPKLLASIGRLSAGQVALGGPLAVLAAIGADNIIELLGAWREVEKVNDQNRATIRKLQADYETLFKKIVEGVEDLANRTDEEIRGALSNALKAEAAAAAEVMAQELKREGEKFALGKNFLAGLFGGVGVGVRLNLIDDSGIEEANKRLEEARSALAAINAEIAKRRPVVTDEEAQAARTVNIELAKTRESVEAYKAALLALENAQVDTIIDRANESFEAQKAALDNAGASAERFVELEQQRATRLIALQEYRQQRTVQIAAQETAEKLALLEEEGLKGEELLKEQQKLFAEFSTFRIKETERSVDGIGDALNLAKKLEFEYVQAARALHRGLADEVEQMRGESLEGAIGGDSPFLAYAALQEQRRRLIEYTTQYEKASEEGRYKHAEEIARKRKALAESLADVQIEGARIGMDIVSQDESRARAAREVKVSNEQITEAMEKQITAAETAAKSQGDFVKDLTGQAENVTEAVRDLQKEDIKINTAFDTEEFKRQLLALKATAEKEPLELVMELNDKEALIRLAELQKPTESTHTVNLVVDDSALPEGVINLQGYAKGGKIPGYASGGKLYGPGTETSDSIIARLSRNEWIINARAARFWGDDFLRSINSMRLPRFATGGPVTGSYTPPSATGGGAAREVVHHIKNDRGQHVTTVRGEPDAVDKLIDALKRHS